MTGRYRGVKVFARAKGTGGAEKNEKKLLDGDAGRTERGGQTDGGATLK